MWKKYLIPALLFSNLSSFNSAHLFFPINLLTPYEAVNQSEKTVIVLESYYWRETNVFY